MLFVIEWYSVVVEGRGRRSWGEGGGGGGVVCGGGGGVCGFFFFKQKTAYEIVSRDWSSDVCSSDLVSWGCRT